MNHTKNHLDALIFTPFTRERDVRPCEAEQEHCSTLLTKVNHVGSINLIENEVITGA